MKRALPALALALVVATGGCGGDDEKKPDPRPPFVKQADRVCLKSGLRPTAIPNDMPQAAAQLSDEARKRAAVHDELAGLKPPADLRADYTRFVEQTGQVAGGTARMAALARAGRQADLAELARRTNAIEADRQRLAKRIGFFRCGRPATEPLRSP